MSTWIQLLIAEFIKAFFRWLKEEQEEKALEQAAKAGKIVKAFKKSFDAA